MVLKAMIMQIRVKIHITVLWVKTLEGQVDNLQCRYGLELTQKVESDLSGKQYWNLWFHRYDQLNCCEHLYCAEVLINLLGTFGCTKQH